MPSLGIHHLLLFFTLLLVPILQTTSQNVPTCVTQCFTSSFPSSGCSAISDATCLCKSQVFISAVNGCINTGCTSSADRAAGVTFAEGICQSVGLSFSYSAPASTAFSSSSAGSSTTSSIAVTTTTTPEPSSSSKSSEAAPSVRQVGSISIKLVVAVIAFFVVNY